jgi:class 3 adenylate cyclase
MVEVESASRTYALLPVDVPEFGFINVYGTDITAVKERERLARENERLLLNILPAPIADRLRSGEPLIADRFDDVTLMFADIVEFTQLSASMSADELVGVLNEVFTVFDGLVDRYGLEKVKTIGDAYMVVGGMPERSDDHPERVAAMALDLASSVGRIDAAARLGITFRIGIHCGPVIAGVIGTRKFIYDVWGDTVNMASRMESLGVPGRVQVTHAIAERLAGNFELEARGLIDVKGKGPTPTYFLRGRTDARSGIE